MNIVILEDDVNMTFLMSKFLKKEKYKVSTFSTGTKLYNQLVSNKLKNEPTVFILDIMVPGLDGISLIDLIKNRWKMSYIIMSSAMNDSQTMTSALNKGADIYLSKPFYLEVLLAHIKKFEKKIEIKANKNDNYFFVNNWKVSKEDRRAINEDQIVKLEHKEAKLLYELWKSRNKYISKKQLLWQVWNIDIEKISTNRLESCISSIRSKLGRNSIISKRGNGYMVGNKGKDE